VGEEPVGDGSHGVLSHSVVEVTAARIVLLETIRLALPVSKKERKSRNVQLRINGTNNGEIEINNVKWGEQLERRRNPLQCINKLP